MPRINKIRVTNIRYADDSKRIPDVIFDADKHNLLFILSNGGGKSLLLQLILQCVLPNCKMGNRRISDMLVNTKFTGHVLVEWLLDGENTNYLLTGFCFTHAMSDNRLVDFFNYTNIYADVDLFDIQNLPLLENQTPITFTTFRKLLIDSQKPSIEVFDTQKAYKDYLEKFHIYSEEWENIRVTNSEEGGVGKFFANCKSTVQFLENIAIPSIERSLYENQHERGILLESFKKHYKSLLEIPTLQKNIDDYGKIAEIAEPLLGHLELNDQKEQERNTQQKKVICLHHYFIKDIIQTQDTLDIISVDFENKNTKINEYDWKLESHKFYLELIEKEKITLKLYEIDENLTEEKTNFNSLQEEKLKLTAFELYADILSQQKECQRINLCIEQITKKDPDIQNELVRALNQFSYAWNKSSQELTLQKKESLFHLQEIQNSIHNALTQKNLLLQKERTSIQEKAVLMNWLEDFSKQKSEFFISTSSLTAESGAEDPTIIEYKLNFKLTELNLKLESLKSEDKSLKRDLDNLQNTMHELVKIESENSSAQKELRQELIMFDKEQTELISQLAINQIINTPELLMQKNSINLAIQHRLSKEKDDLAKISGRCENVRLKLGFIKENDFFVPHPILISIKNMLESIGIFVILGTQWLQEQNFTDTQKQDIIRKNPLLPFAFLAQPEQIHLIDAELSAFGEWDADFPLICIPISQVNTVLLTKDLQFFGSKTIVSNLNSENFALWKENLEKKLQELLHHEHEHQNNYELFVKIDASVKKFYHDFSEKEVNGWRFNLTQIEERAAQLKKEKEKNLEQKNVLLARSLEIENSVSLLNKELSEINEKLYKTRKFCELFVQYGDKDLTYGNVCKTLDDLGREKDILEKRHTDLQNNLSASKEKIRDIEMRLDELDKVKIKYLSGKQIQDEKNEQDYSLLFNKLETLVTNTNLQQSDLVELNKSLEKSLTYLKKDQKRLEDIMAHSRQITLDYLKNYFRTVNKFEIFELNQKITEQEQKILSFQQEKEMMEKSLYRREGVLAEIKKNILQKFTREDIYTGFDKKEHLFEIKTLQNERIDLDKELQEFTKQKNNLLSYMNQAQKARDWIASEIPEEFLINNEHSWFATEILEIKKDPLKFAQKEIKFLINLKSEIEEQRRLILGAFNEFLKQLRHCNNYNLYEFIRETENALSDERLFDFTYVSKIFSHIKQSVQHLKEQSSYRLEQLELNKKQIVERIVARIREIYKDLFDIARYAKISLYDRVIHLLKIEGPVWQNDAAIGSINTYLRVMIDEIKIMEASGKSEDDINNFIENSMTSRMLLNTCVGIEKIKVMVFKPKQESMLKDNKVDILKWDEIERWSGGEKFCAYMGTFLAMTSYLRARSASSSNSWRVLLADNPFGAASSKHILDPVFIMAELNKIQMICFTAHGSDEILKRFHSIYSLKLVPAFGRENMRYEKIERGFYISAQ